MGNAAALTIEDLPEGLVEEFEARLAAGEGVRPREEW
jgi:hypothetical protein